MELTKDPVTITYDQAMTNYRNEVNLKFPPQMGNENRRHRRINETRRGGGRVSHSRGGRGRGGRGGRGRYRYHDRNNGHSRPGARIIRCTDGSSLEVHASYHFPDDVYMKIPVDERNKLRSEREAYKRRRYDNDQGSNNGSSNTPPSVISEVTTGTTGDTKQNNGGSQSGGCSFMGSRNEQASLCGRNPNNNN